MTDLPSTPIPAANKGRDERHRAALAAVAPGTALRDGLERILRGSTGALIVLGFDQAVADLCSGGFELNVEFSATRLRELAKMDGAIVLDGAAHTIVRAAVQLVPDPSIPTDEAGTRHRTAERVARQTQHTVISVSKSMRIIALFIDGTRFVLEESAAVLSHANQALATLERYRRRLDEISPPSVTSRPWLSGWRWSAGSRARSRVTWWSWAPTAGCWPCTTMSSWPEPSRTG
jgi:diadenylate cyclase